MNIDRSKKTLVSLFEPFLIKNLYGNDTFIRHLTNDEQISWMQQEWMDAQNEGLVPVGLEGIFCGFRGMRLFPVHGDHRKWIWISKKLSFSKAFCGNNYFPEIKTDEKKTNAQTC